MTTAKPYSMTVENKAIRVFLWIGLLFCMLVLSKYILFKNSPHYYKHYFAREYKRYTVSKGWEEANLKPFHTIRLFTSKNVRAEYSYKNIGGNIIGFIPLGLLLPLLFSFLRRFFRLTGTVFLISLSFEITQLVAGIGVFDVDDLILNTAGGIIGYILYAFSAWLMRKMAGNDQQLI